METQLVKKTQEEIIQDHFAPFETTAREWAEKAKTIKVTSADQELEIARAREARLKIREVRLSVDSLHKELKEDSLRKGQALDKIKRTLIALIEPTEKYLEEQENFVKMEEVKRKSELNTLRVEHLKQYISEEEARRFPLAELAQDAFDNMLRGFKLAKEQRLQDEADAKAAKEKSDKEQLEKWEKVKAENAKLQAERDKQQAKLKKEREERKKAEDELKAKQEAEEKKARDEANAKRRAARLPDRVKLADLASDLRLMKFPAVSDPESKIVLEGVAKRLADAAKYIDNQLENL